MNSLLDELNPKESPLADRMRPRTLNEFIGQSHILAPGRLLRRCIEADRLSSLIFYGPPGTGKTTLAKIIANTTQSAFLMINAVLDGVKEIKACVEEAKSLQSLYNRRTILFVDEVHRFNKSQQDALLPHVENGLIIFIGATTENPYFEINKALISRSNIFSFQSLTKTNLYEIVNQVLGDKERGYGNFNIHITDEALEHLCETANGDARTLMNALELAVISSDLNAGECFVMDRELIEDSMQKKAVLYDKDGDYHYDVISAFIKSLRGSDVDAALYWLAKMVYAGENPRYIFRRMIIFACEDVGMADPLALTYTVSAMQGFEFVGMPEGAYHLSSACIYLSTCLKSNSSMAYFQAMKAVETEKDDDVPNHLKDSSRDKEEFGHGKNYMYPHSYKEHFVPQQYLPDAFIGRLFYSPSNQGKEIEINKRVERIRELQLADFQEENAADMYSERLYNNAVELKEHQRAAFFDFIKVGNTPLVFVPYAERGWLAAEAIRRYPHGTFYLNCLTANDEEIIRHLLKNDLSKKDISIFSEKSPGALMDRFCRQKIRFDLIFFRVLNKTMICDLFAERSISSVINENGAVYLMANNVMAGSRLSDFLNQSDVHRESAVSALIKNTEESVVKAFDCCNSIETISEFSPFQIEEKKSTTYTSSFTISQGYIDQLTKPDSAFMKKLQETASESKVNAVVSCIRELRHQTVKRTTVTELYRIKANRETAKG